MTTLDQAAIRKRRLGYQRFKTFLAQREVLATAGPPPELVAEPAIPVPEIPREGALRLFLNRLRYAYIYKALGLVLVVATVFIVSFLAVTYTQVRRAFPGTAPVKAEGRKNLLFLVLGTDSRRGERGRSDTMLLVNVGLEVPRVKILSLPRDTYATVRRREKTFKDKLNHSYAFEGAAGAVEAVEKLLGVTVDHHAVVSYGLFERIVDLAGGVPIDVEKRMDYDDYAGNFHVHLKKGPQILDGHQSLGYVRFRHDARGDLGRIQRQQTFLKALTGQLQTPRALSMLILNLPSLFQYVETDVPMQTVLSLLYKFRAFDSENLAVSTLKGKGTRIRNPRYGNRSLSYLLVEQDELSKRRRWLLELDPPPPEPAAATFPSTPTATPPSPSAG